MLEKEDGIEEFRITEDRISSSGIGNCFRAFLMKMIRKKLGITEKLYFRMKQRTEYGKPCRHLLYRAFFNRKFLWNFLLAPLRQVCGKE